MGQGILISICLYVFCFTGSSLASNSTQFNSSHVVSHLMGLKSELPAKAMSISSSQIHAHKPRAAEEPGNIALGEHRPYRSITDSVKQKHRSDVAVGGMGASLPTMTHGKAQLDFKEERIEDIAPRWHTEILQPDGSVLDLDSHPPSLEQSLFLSEPVDSSPIIKVSFSEPDQQHQIEIPPQESQGGDPTSWTLLDFYDYLSPDYSTTESYSDNDQSTPEDLEDENIQLVRKAAPDNSQSLSPDDGASGGDGPSGPPGAVGRVGNSGCLLGFVRKNGTCQSPCDVYTSYCFNGGQCYVVEGIGAFCR